ncbi:mycofactocin precursor MftA [Streptomyces sp. NPDC088350]
MNDSTQTRTEEQPAQETPPTDALVEADELVEEISIDGMCGVY